MEGHDETEFKEIKRRIFYETQSHNHFLVLMLMLGMLPATALANDVPFVLEVPRKLTNS